MTDTSDSFGANCGFYGPMSALGTGPDLLDLGVPFFTRQSRFPIWVSRQWLRDSPCAAGTGLLPLRFPVSTVENIPDEAFQDYGLELEGLYF